MIYSLQVNIYLNLSTVRYWSFYLAFLAIQASQLKGAVSIYLYLLGNDGSRLKVGIPIVFFYLDNYYKKAKPSKRKYL